MMILASTDNYSESEVECFPHPKYPVSYGPRREKTCLWGFANNKAGTDQPAHPRRLISAFIIHLLESTISRLATSELSISS